MQTRTSFLQKSNPVVVNLRLGLRKGEAIVRKDILYLLPLLLLFLLGLPVGRGEGKEVKNIKVIVAQSYGEAGAISLPIYELASKFLSLSGLKIVSEDSADYDAILKINVKGEPIKSRYIPQYYYPEAYCLSENKKEIPSKRGSGDEVEALWREFQIPTYFHRFFLERDEELLYSGARLQGEIIWETRFGNKLREDFEGKRQPCPEFKKDDLEAQFDMLMYKNPEGAPFLGAFLAPGSFPDKLALLIGKALGVKSLLSAMSSRDWRISESAREALTQLGIPPLRDLLCLLEKSAPAIRLGTAKLLGYLGDKQALPCLIKILMDEKEPLELRCAVAWALGKIGDERALPPLNAIFRERKCQESCQPLKQEASSAVVKIEQKRMGERINLGYPVDSSLSDLTIERLRESEDLRELLISSLRKGDVRLSPALVNAIVKIGEPFVEPLINLLQDKSSKAPRGAIVSILSKIGDERAVDALFSYIVDCIRENVLSSESVGNLDIKEAKLGLYRIGKPAVKVLLPALKHPYAKVRETAVQLLSLLGVEEAVEPIKELVMNKGETIREKALVGLSFLDEEEAVNCALSILSDDSEDNRLRISVLYFLISKNVSSFEALASIISKKEGKWEQMPMLRLAAIAGVGKLRERRAIPLLLNILQDPAESSFIKTISARALLRMGFGKEEETREVLTTLVESIAERELLPLVSCEKKRKASIAFLGKAINILKGKPDLREKAQALLSALQKRPLSQDSVPQIFDFLSALSDFLPENPLLWEQLQNLLSSSLQEVKLSDISSDNKDIIGLLRSLFMEAFYSPATRSNAVYSLGEMADILEISPQLKMQVVDVLLIYLKDDSAKVREACARALGEIGDKRAIVHLRSLLRDRALMVRSASALALARLRDGESAEQIVDLLRKYEGGYFASSTDYERFAKEVWLAIFLMGKSVVKPLLSFIRERDLSPDESLSFAINVVGKLRDPEAVETLISLLPFCYPPHPSGYQESFDDKIISALRLITYEDFGRDIPLWREWWKERRGKN